jgi:hypothetical protein
MATIERPPASLSLGDTGGKANHHEPIILDMLATPRAPQYMQPFFMLLINN